MATFRKLDDWRHYIERVNHFFEANGITNPGKGRSIFLVGVGAKSYKLVRSLLALEDPKYKSYEDLAKHLQEHFMPNSSAIVQRFKLNTRSQQPGETIAMFLAELRHLTEHCEFGSTLEEMLRDRLVCRVRDIRIQRQLAEPKLTLKRALDLALAIEAADKDVSETQKGDSQGGDPSLNKIDVVAANTTQKAVILRMPNVMLVAKLAIYLDYAKPKRKGSKHSQLMSRSQATPSLHIV